MSEFVLGSISDIVFNGLKNVGINFVYLLISPIVSALYSMVSFIEPFLTFVENVFQLIKPFVVYAMDLSFITPVTWGFIILAITLRITYGLLFYSIKLIVSWYHYLVP